MDVLMAGGSYLGGSFSGEGRLFGWKFIDGRTFVRWRVGCARIYARRLAGREGGIWRFAPWAKWRAVQ